MVIAPVSVHQLEGADCLGSRDLCQWHMTRHGVLFSLGISLIEPMAAMPAAVVGQLGPPLASTGDPWVIQRVCHVVTAQGSPSYKLFALIGAVYATLSLPHPQR